MRKTLKGYIKKLKFNGQITRVIEECTRGHFEETDFVHKGCKTHHAIWTKNGYKLK